MQKAVKRSGLLPSGTSEEAVKVVDLEPINLAHWGLLDKKKTKPWQWGIPEPKSTK